MGMSGFELKRFLLFAFPLPILVMFPVVFALRGLWVPALACPLGAAAYLGLVWRWQRIREADEALARAALHDAADAEHEQVHAQIARGGRRHTANDLRGAVDQAGVNGPFVAAPPPTASAPAQGPPAESSPPLPAP